VAFCSVEWNDCACFDSPSLSFASAALSVAPSDSDPLFAACADVAVWVEK